MRAGVHSGVLAGTAVGGGGGAPLAISGTMREGETLSASGGSGSYTWRRQSDSAVLGTGATYALTASEVGEVPVLDDGTTTVAESVVGSSALVWYSAADYSAGLANRGTVGSAADLVVTGSGNAVITGADDVGPFIAFDEGQYLHQSSAFETGYTGTDYTLYAFHNGHDGVGTEGFIFDFKRSGNRFSLRKRTTTTANELLDSNYRSYRGYAGGVDHLFVATLDGGTPEGSGFTYFDIEDDAKQTYNPQTIDTGVRMAMGGLVANLKWLKGKVRFVAVYPGLHNATKRAEVRAALKRVWPLVDSDPATWTGAMAGYSAEDVATSPAGADTVIDQFNDIVGSQDVPLLSGAGKATLQASFNGSGKPYARALDTDDVSYQRLVFDTGISPVDKWSAIYWGQLHTNVNAGRTWQYGGNSSNPQTRQTPAVLGFYPENTGPIVLTPLTPTTFCESWDGATALIDIGTEVAEAAVSPTGHANNKLLRLLGSGTLGPDMSLVKLIFYSRGLTPTERLLARCYGAAEYGIALP